MFINVSCVHASTEGQKVLDLINDQRKIEGMAPLKWNEKLANAASLKAADMISNNYWDHNSPDGKTPWVFVKKAKYGFVSAGENLAKGFSSDEKMVLAWMKSPTHKANIISKKYKESGVAVVTGKIDGNEVRLVVQMFGSSSVLSF